jgi:hypothetical protein
MNMNYRIFKSTIIGVSIFGAGLLSPVTAALAGSTMPPGYTLSQTQLKGKYCYRHNNEVNLYCYSSRLTPSKMMMHNSMMKKDGAMMKGNSMMKKDGAMMKGDSMMKKDGAMMKGQ